MAEGTITPTNSFLLYAFVPRGAFTSPASYATVPRLVELEGYTKNIPSEHRFVWVVVDVPNVGLCWPHRRIYRVNTPFKAKMPEPYLHRLSLCRTVGRSSRDSGVA